MLKTESLEELTEGGEHSATPGIGALAERLRKQVCFFDQRCHGHLFLCACISKGFSNMPIERTFYLGSEAPGYLAVITPKRSAGVESVETGRLAFAVVFAAHLIDDARCHTCSRHAPFPSCGEFGQELG